MRTFDSLNEREILALAISLEEEDERIYADFAEGLREEFPASAAIFDGMRQEEAGHRRRLIELYREKFGDHVPLLRRQDVKGFVNRRPVWLVRPLGLESVRRQAESMEVETRASFTCARLPGLATPAFGSCLMTSRRRSFPTNIGLTNSNAPS